MYEFAFIQAVHLKAGPLPVALGPSEAMSACVASKMAADHKLSKTFGGRL